MGISRWIDTGVLFQVTPAGYLFITAWIREVKEGEVA